MHKQKVLIYDIETTSKRVNDADIVLSGWYSSIFGYGKSWNVHELVFQLMTHDVIVGFNNRRFDNQIVTLNTGFEFKNKIIVDLWEILAPKNRGGKARAAVIAELSLKGFKDTRIHAYNLDTVLETLKKTFPTRFSYSKGKNFDYGLFKKKVLSKEEISTCEEYLESDVMGTKELYDFMEWYFGYFKDNLPEDMNRRKIYITSSIAAYDYKFICNELGLPEIYSDQRGEKFKGGHVIEPVKKHYSGRGVCSDFASQHPSNQRSGNLHTPISKCKHKIDGMCPNPYTGGKVFKLEGIYCGCEQGPVEKLITRLYILRKEYKRRKDPRQYTLKIIINALYGLSSSPTFASLYNPTIGPDTTRMSRQSLRFMQEYLTYVGYDIFYGDTDSLFLLDPFKQNDRLTYHLRKGVKEIKDSLPFADEHYEMEIEYTFSDMFFFEMCGVGNAVKFRKKNYIIMTDDPKNPIIVHGLPIIKSNTTALSKKIVEKYLLERMLSEKRVEFNKEEIDRAIEIEVRTNPRILETEYKVDDPKNYTSQTSIQYQIASVLGSGRWKLIKTKKGNIGKNERYCNSDDIEKMNLKFNDYDLRTVYSELAPFIKDKETQVILDKWYGDVA